MKDITLSIIVPIYKVENYLRICIDSVLKQTYDNFELILVDDGSPDNCPAICDEYAQNDNRIKVIHKKNAGLSSARNSGLLSAKGDYVIFLDSDDYYLKDDFFQIIIDKISESRTDIYFFKRSKYYEKTQQLEISENLYSDKELEIADFGQLLLELSKNDRIEANASLKVISKELLIKNELFFKEGIISEDIEWFFRLALQIKNASLINNANYCYRIREGSISRSKNKKNLEDLLDIIENYSYIYKNLQSNNSLKKAILNYISYEYYISMGLLHLFNLDDDKEYFSRFKKLKWLAKYSISKKTKICKFVLKLFGVKFSSKIFSVYIKRKNFS